MYNRLIEFSSFLLGSLRMSDAVIALIAAAVTTIGLAVVNKLMSRPSEAWKQASEMREELRSDLNRSNTELDRLRDRSQTLDIDYIEIKSSFSDITIQLKNVMEDLKHCLDSHKRVDRELAKIRLELKSCVKSGG